MKRYRVQRWTGGYLGSWKDISQHDSMTEAWAEVVRLKVDGNEYQVWDAGASTEDKAGV